MLKSFPGPGYRHSEDDLLVNLYIYIQIHVFRSAQDSSVWLGLTNREQLMSPECSKHKVLSFAEQPLQGMQLQDKERQKD